jgi:hypothetical protein
MFDWYLEATWAIQRKIPRSVLPPTSLLEPVHVTIPNSYLPSCGTPRFLHILVRPTFRA